MIKIIKQNSDNNSVNNDNNNNKNKNNNNNNNNSKNNNNNIKINNNNDIVTMPILLGDFNLHWDVPSDPDVTAVRDILNTHGLHQVIDQPTHIKNHILDWLITDSLDNVHLVHVQSFRAICSKSSIEIRLSKPDEDTTQSQ